MSRAEQRKREAEQRLKQLQKESKGEKEYAAWEKEASKQFVRRLGWGNVIEKYITKMHDLGIDRPWKYLTLPGPHALDIAYLDKRGLIERTDTGELCVAICDKDHADEVSLSLEKHGGLLASSFDELENTLNDPYNPIVKQFPFDVINLDFTNSFFRIKRENLNVLDLIFKHQRGQSFLLFITSRPYKDFDEHFINLIKRNIELEEGFRRSYEEKFGSTEPEACLQNYKDFELIAIPKLVARIAREMGYKITEQFIGTYQRRNSRGKYEMIAETLELMPVGRKQGNVFKPRFELDEVYGVGIGKLLDCALGDDLLSNLVRTQTLTLYGKFIETLPKRDVIDVTNKIKSDDDLHNELFQESLNLQTWIGD